MRALCLGVLALAAVSCRAREAATVEGSLPLAAIDSARQFAQRFYAWYVPSGARFELAVRDSGQYFEPSLLAAMREDIAASAASKDEIVGLDWDPFLATQDPCPGYRLGAASSRGDRVVVPVVGDCTQRADSSPDVVAYLARGAHGWVFADFGGTSEGTLLRDLAGLKRERDSLRAADSAPRR